MGKGSTDPRTVWAIIAVTIIVSAYFFARGATRLAAAHLLAEDTKDGVATRPIPHMLTHASVTTQRANPDAIVQRNIFDSTPIAPPTADEEEVVDDPNRPPDACSGTSIRLIGTVVMPRDESSLASIATAEGESEIVSVNGDVAGYRLVSVQSERVHVKPAGGRTCYLAMFAKAGAASDVIVKPAAAPEEDSQSNLMPPSTAQSAIPPEELDRGIQKVNDTTYNISKSLVQKILENQAEIMRSARVMPHKENGRVVGVKLYGIRQNSILARIGLQNGDMLRTINGYDMASPDKALEAYTRLRNASNLSIAIERRGKPMNFQHTIR